MNKTKNTLLFSIHNSIIISIIINYALSEAYIVFNNIR